MIFDIISEVELSNSISKLQATPFEAGEELLNNPIFGRFLVYYIFLTEYENKVHEKINYSSERIYLSRYFYYLKFYKLFLLFKKDNEGLYQLYMNLLVDRPDSISWEALKKLESIIDTSLNYLDKDIPKVLNKD